MVSINIDYDNSILSVSNSILKFFNGTAEYKTLQELDIILNKNYKNVVLMILDGMGTSILRKNLPQNSFLNSHILKNISSVFPPTTTAATTAFHSGLPPLRSGWLGWMSYFPKYDKIIELFSNTEFYSGQAVPEPAVAQTFISYESIYSQIIKNNPEVEYHKIFPPFDKNGVNTFEEMCKKVVQTVQQNPSRKIISAYWTEPDHSIHLLGTKSPEIIEILKNMETQIKKMSQEIEDTVVIISADHGAVDIEEIYLNSYADICETFERPPALEDRFLTFFVKPGQKNNFQNLFQKYFGNEFVLFTKDEFLVSGILGKGKKHPMVEDFIGDFVAIAVRNKSLKYSTGEREFPSFKANHAGFSWDEMTVPLIVLEKK